VLNFAVEQEWIQFNTVRAVRKPRKVLVTPFYVPTEDELYRILEVLFPAARRFFLVLCNTGCRLSELANTNVADADLERSRLRVIRKGRRIDFVPINQALRWVIEEELDGRIPRPTDPLFVNSRGNRYNTIRKPLETATRRAGVPHTTHHSLRHAYATPLREKGLEIESISKLLGHSTLTVTQNIYVHWHDEKVKKVAETIQIGGDRLSPTSLQNRYKQRCPC